MTDQAFYQRMQDLATRLLTKFGAPASLHPKNSAGKQNALGIVPPTQPAPVDIVCLACQTPSQTALDLLNDKTLASVVLKTPTVPAVGWTLTHGARQWRIQEVKELTPDGQTLIICFLGVSQL